MIFIMSYSRVESDRFSLLIRKNVETAVGGNTLLLSCKGGLLVAIVVGLVNFER